VYIHAARADTFPNVVLEALACGTPVVATKVGGISEQIENGKTGFLVSVGDALGMADSVQRLIENETLYNQISEQAAKVAIEKFDLERMVDDYLGWYQHILNAISTT
ncbi:MAG: glycosyltransferase, partial [Pseudanabaena sp.]